ncbi:hypothetical protein ACFSUI_17835 [Ralstonia solanacearum]
MQWLKIRSRVLRLRGWLPGCTKLIRAKPSWTKRIVAAIVLVLTTLTALLNLPSMLSTLSGYSVPALWAMWHTKPAAPSGAKPSTPQAPSPAASSVVSGSQNNPDSSWASYRTGDDKCCDARHLREVHVLPNDRWRWQLETLESPL